MCDNKGIVLMETLLFLVLLSICVLLLSAAVYSYRQSLNSEIVHEERIREAYESK